MRYLLHSGNSTYDSVTKKYTFSLDERIEDPTSFRITKASYVAATAASYPSVVYLRSDALSQLCSRKHTVELKSQNHRDGTNIIAVLEERHNKSRYSLEEQPRTLSVKKHENVTEIDIYFTDNRTILDGEATTTTTASGTDEDIEAIGSDLLAWFDFAPARTLDSTFSPAENAGDDVNYLYNRSPGPGTLSFINQYGSAMQLALVGETKGITRNGSWQSMADSSTPTGDLEELFTVHCLTISPPSIGTFSYLFDLGPLLKTFFWTGGAIGFKNKAGNNATEPVSLIPGRAYLISIQRRQETIDHDGDGILGTDYEFYWTIEDMVAETTVNHITEPGNDHPGSEQVWRLGHASTHFSHVLGPWIVHNGNDADHITTCQTWLRNKYTGDADPEETVSTTTEASFFLELDIKAG
mgnify:FL=1